MASYSVVVRGADGLGPSKQLRRMLNNIARIDSFMDALGDEVVLPILEEHYKNSGLHVRSGDLLAAITKRGAKGNIFQKMRGQLGLGVDYGQLPYAKWVIEGRGFVYPVRASALRWIDPNTGNPIFAKFARPVPAHPIFVFTPDELTRVEHALMLKLMWTQSRDAKGRLSA